MAEPGSLRYTRYAWGVLVLNLGVILWGAFVRATGSGAGCGSHWPLCNGVALPRDPATATLIEFTHRLTSGLALLAVLGLCVWAFRAFPKGDLTRRSAAASLALILVEALLGAGIVLLEYVEQNKSFGRAIYLCAHLTNTLLLIGALTCTAWFSSRGIRSLGEGRWRLRLHWGFAAALVAAVTGAIAALGDTLFPAASLAEGLRADFSADSHLLLRLRLFHPVVAACAGAYLLYLGFLVLRREPVFAARALIAVTAIQLAAGVVNVLLLAPVWMQLLHLFLGNILWISLVVLYVEDRAGQKVNEMSAST